MSTHQAEVQRGAGRSLLIFDDNFALGEKAPHEHYVARYDDLCDGVALEEVVHEQVALAGDTAHNEVTALVPDK